MLLERVAQHLEAFLAGRGSQLIELNAGRFAVGVDAAAGVLGLLGYQFVSRRQSMTDCPRRFVRWVG